MACCLFLRIIISSKFKIKTQINVNVNDKYILGESFVLLYNYDTH